MCASKIVLQLLLFFSSFGLVFAGRRTQDYQHVLATLGDEADFGESMQSAEPCLQEAPLKEVLLTMGFKESKLTDLHNGLYGVNWEGCKVVEINLWGRFHLAGSLSPRFSELPDLQVLDLGETKVSGDIEALKNLRKLQVLNLPSIKVSGDLLALKNLKKLKELRLYETDVIGDMSALENLTKLTYFNLHSTEVSGDISALENLRDLEAFSLAYTNVIGDMSALGNLRELTTLNLHTTKASGNISALENLRDLRHLDLANTNVIGDMSALENLRDLRYLDLANTKVFGNIAALENLRELEAFSLANTKVFGNIAALENLRELEAFSLANTNAIGDMAALGSTLLEDNFDIAGTKITCGDALRPVLQSLGIQAEQLTDLKNFEGVKRNGCKVVKINLNRRFHLAGSLSPRFSELPDLQVLDLGETKVSGDIEALKNLRKLTTLNLYNTKASGNISALENLRDLRYLDLPNTKVFGNIAALENLRDLRYLDLQLTRVSGNIAALETLTKLTELKLSYNTKLIGDMSSLRSTSLGYKFFIESTKITCEDAALRSVLRSLGLQAEQLTDLMNFKGVTRDGLRNCWVVGIDLSNRPDVSGSLDENFKQLKDLKQLNLGNTKASGDISLLRNNTKLDYLNLQNTSVFGDLAALQKATELQSLNLYNTMVFGDLATLQKATKLQSLNLYNTSVFGDLAALHRATQLKDFNSFEVSNTNITCPQEAALQAVLIKLGFQEQQLQDLHAMEGPRWRNCQVTEIDFGSHSNQVNGALDERFGEFDGLERLHLASSKASGDITLLRNNTKLKHLDMSGTRVSGDISTMLSWKEIQSVDLSGTGVAGQPDGTWKGCCQELQELNLAGSKVRFRPPQIETGEKHSWMPKLTNLDLTKCPINSDVSELLKSFQHCTFFGSLQAVSSGLTGHLDGRATASSLVALDLASNKLTHVEAVPPRCKSLILSGNSDITFSQGVLQRAMKDGVFLDLQNVTFAKEEAADLFKKDVIQKTASQTVSNSQGGFACFDLTSNQLAVTPYKFAPDILCSCSPGWHGSGTQCEMCPANYFKNDTSLECIPCPEGSTAPNGSASPENCKCKVGELFEKNGELLCGCPAHQARLEEGCLPCADLHLDCSSEGSKVVSARALPGFARVGNENRSFRCLPPEQRCHSVHSFKMSKSACADGYVGVMCMDCASNFYAAGRACKECQDYDLEFPNPWLFTPVIVIVVVVLALWLWRRRNTEPEVQQVRCKSFFTEFKEQIQAQGPILLQHCQLWGVLAALRKTTDASSSWEIPYIETLQFSLSSLKGALNLQCKFDGPAVRLGFALMAPVVPLLVISFCLILEVFSTGSGISAMLKAITILYIGGASGTSSLLTCQDLDGNQEPLPADYTFRSATPAILCTEHTNMKIWVDIIGYVCAFVYAIVIPTFMLYVFYRQRVALRSSRMITASATCDGDLKVFLHEVQGSTTERISRQDEAFCRRLVATAVSYISILYRGRLVRLQLTDGFAIVTPIDVERGQSQGLDGLDVLVSSILESEDAKHEMNTLTGITIAEMLRERCALQEVIEGDRVLRGAQNLLCKYRIGNNVWMEVVQKLVAVALVSMVTSADGLQNCFGINLGMAAACAMVQAYARPQVNLLQSFCFLCLALATLSFYYGWVWSSRAAFALPFVVTAVQGLRPDSPETLALRLWQELDTKMPALQKGEAVEISADTFSFI